MSADLIARLRAQACTDEEREACAKHPDGCVFEDNCQLEREAADEIERLRAERDELAEIVDSPAGQTGCSGRGARVWNRSLLGG